MVRVTMNRLIYHDPVKIIFPKNIKDTSSFSTSGLSVNLSYLSILKHTEAFQNYFEDFMFSNF